MDELRKVTFLYSSADTQDDEDEDEDEPLEVTTPPVQPPAVTAPTTAPVSTPVTETALPATSSQPQQSSEQLDQLRHMLANIRPAGTNTIYIYYIK